MASSHAHEPEEQWQREAKNLEKIRSIIREQLSEDDGIPPTDEEVERQLDALYATCLHGVYSWTHQTVFMLLSLANAGTREKERLWMELEQEYMLHHRSTTPPKHQELMAWLHTLPPNDLHRVMDAAEEMHAIAAWKPGPIGRTYIRIFDALKRLLGK